MRPLDLAGKKFGRWTVIKKVENNKRNNTMWLCKCECGTEKIIKGYSLTSGDTRSCRCYIKEVIGDMRRMPDRKERLLNRVYNDLKQRHKKVGNENEEMISRKKLEELSLQNCFYCENEPSRKVIDPINEENFILVNGVDRIDSNKGYIENNCIPCCSECNFAKHTMTQEQFFKWVQKIYTNLKEKNLI